MGGFLGIGGSSAKTDRGRALEGWEKQWDVFNRTMGFGSELQPDAKATTEGGLETLGLAKDFWTGILGDRTAAMTAVAPEIQSINETADSQRRTEAEFGTSRGGGVAGQRQQAETDRMTAINNALFGARPIAATQAARIGETEARIGMDQLTQVLQSFGLSANVASDIVRTSIESRGLSHDISPARMPEYILGRGIMSLFGLGTGTGA